MTAEALLLCIFNWVDQDAVSAESVSSVAIGTGSKTFTVAANTRFYVGATLTARANEGSGVDTDVDYMVGEVTAYNIGAGVVTMNVTEAPGGGTHADWTLTQDRWYGGDWLDDLPLDNLVDDRLYKPARSDGLDFEATQFRRDLGANLLVNVFAVPSHNGSQDGKWWRRLFTVNPATGAFTCVYDSGLENLWPIITPPDDQPYGLWPWEGRLLVGEDYRPPLVALLKEQFTTTSDTELEISVGDKTLMVGDVSDLYIAQPVSLYRDADHTIAMAGKVIEIGDDSVKVRVARLSAEAQALADTAGTDLASDWILRGTKLDGATEPVIARIADVFIDDEDNPATDGLELDRLVIAAGTQIENLADCGIAPVDDSQKRRSRGGQPFVNARPVYDRFRVSLGFLDRTEMLASIGELQHVKGVRRPILVSIDPGDTTNLHRMTLWGSLVSLAEMRPSPGAPHRWGVELVFEQWLSS